MCSKPLLLILILFFACEIFADKTKEKLQIGIKKRVENCSIKSKKGDFLHIHYSVSTKKS